MLRNLVLSRCLLVVLFVFFSSGLAHAETVAILADAMLDVKSGKLVEYPLIIVEDGRITQVGSQDGIDGVQQRLDLGRGRGPRIPFAHHHASSLPLTGARRKCLVRQCTEPITLCAALRAVSVGRIEHRLGV